MLGTCRRCRNKGEPRARSIPKATVEVTCSARWSTCSWQGFDRSKRWAHGLNFGAETGFVVLLLLWKPSSPAVLSLLWTYLQKNALQLLRQRAWWWTRV
jgi:hypothetical protein